MAQAKLVDLWLLHLLSLEEVVEQGVHLTSPLEALKEVEVDMEQAHLRWNTEDVEEEMDLLHYTLHEEAREEVEGDVGQVC